MVKLANAISRLASKKVLLLGDLMLDSYTIGSVRRISPEAPVPVLNVHEQYERIGGAGNVLLNMLSMGLEPIMVGRIGSDATGEVIRAAMKKEGLTTEGLCVQETWKTPVKNRIIAGNQQLVRLDYEEGSTPSTVQEAALQFARGQLDQVGVVALSDYGKGFLSTPLIRAVIDEAKKRSIPVIVDPKGRDFSKYNGATILKPNVGEAYAAAGLDRHENIESVADQLHKQFSVDSLFITRSEEGISLFFKDGKHEHFPVRIRQIKDVTGAGDTVLAVLSCALANGLSLTEGARLSNIAAGIAIEQLGCARVGLGDIAKRLYEDDALNKILDASHLFLLETILKEHPYTLIRLQGTLSSELFKALRAAQGEVILFLETAQPEETVHFIAGLDDVDFVLTDAASLQSLLARFSPLRTISL